MSGADAGSSPAAGRSSRVADRRTTRSASVDAARPVIRPLRWWELPAVTALEPVLFGADAWSAAMFWSELAQHETRYYVGSWDGDAMTGYAGLSVTTDEAWVQTIGVAPDRRRRGLATDLLLDLLAQGRRRGAATVWLEVGAGNLGAQALYERHGFATVGRRRGYYEATGEDALIMRAPL
jgi:ribosomal-protein-alanine N-acetyltransferase